VFVWLVCPRLFTESSAEGDRDAHAHLAAMHLQGMGTPKDAAKAVELYTKAAEKGHVRAQAALAVRRTLVARSPREGLACVESTS